MKKVVHGGRGAVVYALQSIAVCALSEKKVLFVCFTC